MLESKVRKRILGNRARIGRVITFEVPGDNGPEKVEVELRQPSSAMKYTIGMAAGFDEETKKVGDAALFAALVIAECAYEPGKAEKMFDKEDVPALRSLGQEWDPLVTAAMKFFAPEEATELGNESRVTPSSG